MLKKWGFIWNTGVYRKCFTVTEYFLHVSVVFPELAWFIRYIYVPKYCNLFKLRSIYPKHKQP